MLGKATCVDRVYVYENYRDSDSKKFLSAIVMNG